MAFVKKTWKDRISQYPNRRTITDENGVTKPVTVGRDEGEVTQEGDAFSASNMNDLEVRIESAFASGGGGGGGGGHTILDDSGTALPQRAGLQFKGAYSEDNSTDGVTEVNIVRNMTKAEFDLLPDNKKKGIINVTDITSGRDDRFQPVIYSEEEREIGVNYDGKPLYAITLVTTQDANLSNNRWTNLYFSNQPADIDTLTWLSFTGAGTYPNFYEQMRVTYDNEIPGFKAAAQSSMTYRAGSRMYIEYTKTTDTAGSGQWTPQGVPAVHYSTEEQVVGTWIDGSTIYEKGLTVSGTLGDTFNYIPHGVSNFNQLLDYFGYCTYGSSDKMNIPSLRGSSYVTISSWDATNIRLERANLSSAISDVNLVIRYTKSST